jgi:phosphatidylglycerol:prolipoprotein diacylglycerol transferase
MLAAPITHHPLDYALGPLRLTGFGLAVLAAFVVSQHVAVSELERRGHPHEANVLPDVVLASIIGTLVGAKTYYVILTGDVSAFLSRGGFVFWGGFIGSVILSYLTIKWRKADFIRISDATGIAIMAGYAVGRTGCWAVGDDYGSPWSGPLAVMFPQGAPPSTAIVMNRSFGTPIPPGTTADAVLAVHPTQLYETAIAFVFFLILWRFRKHKHAEGWLFGLYCVLAGLERFIVEFFRAKDDRLLGPLTLAQGIALAIAAGGAWWMMARSQPGPGRPGIYSEKAAAA